MKFLAVFMMAFGLSGLAQADDFGSRFSGQVPQALGDIPSDEEAATLQDINPAAGNEQPESQPEETVSAPGNEEDETSSVDSADGVDL